MFKKIKEYFNYRKNKKIAKRAITNTIATTLSFVNKFTDNKSDTVDFFYKLVESSKEIGGEALVTMVLGEIVDKFALDNEKLINLVQNIASLSPEDISKIVSYSMVDIVSGNTDLQNK